MDWQEVCEHPSLQNLPFKVELNHQGHVIMTPVKVYHSAFQGKIGILLDRILKKGHVLTECAIHTKSGTKVADVAWASKKTFDQVKHEVECSIAPEICIEVLSTSNTDVEMAEKRTLYFENGCQEVWFCTEQGEMRFYHAQGKIAQSILVPTFPSNITH